MPAVFGIQEGLYKKNGERTSVELCLLVWFDYDEIAGAFEPMVLILRSVWNLVFGKILSMNMAAGDEIDSLRIQYLRS